MAKRPIMFFWISGNQRFPSGPTTIANESAGYAGTVSSRTAPALERLPILACVDQQQIVPYSYSVYQMLPSGPSTIPVGLVPVLKGVGTVNSVTEPEVVILPMPPNRVNQRLPSEPATIPLEMNSFPLSLNSVNPPAGVILPMLVPK